MADTEIYSGYLPEDVWRARRTRDAVRRIRRLAVGPTAKKKFLAVWFQQHLRAATAPGAKHQAYTELLGAFHRSRMQG
jgi:hypothetical protein